ncbi:NACHT domain-containing NTPase [Trichocoleus sp. Lan]|uniref:NACHT domain-containing protein n=1 Tax=Trichocoleus sp. Lan TaxID=2933927 RepID=UPI003296AC5A
MSQPIDLNAIYTTVNILEKITGRRRLEIAELLQGFSLDDFDRFSLSRVQEERVPALDAVEKHAKLMILGKPGSGKTTFLKYVALQCIEGNFKPAFVPLFITLKEFAEAPHKLSLLDYLIQLFRNYGVDPDTKIETGMWTRWLSGNATPVELLLKQGKILLLLDGLDEVKETDNNWVLQEIKSFTNQFSKNLFVITCRIAAREYIFERFTEVEVADFDDQQISTFANQWFQAKNDEVKSKAFIKTLQKDESIRELATSPLLLTLLCLVFEESGSFPANRSELYKEGLDVLLKKWDVKRNIKRSQVYKKLSLKRKEDLLSQIALDTFEQGNYFFKQKEAERYITQYIRNLPDSHTDEESLQLDSEAVLKSIEAQHGLFVERAREIYSFSHLTFHEYFTARKIVTSANSEVLLKKLSPHTTEKRWREVFLLAVGMLESADQLLRAMKQEIDHLLAKDDQLQLFLSWVTEKSKSVQASYKSSAIRAYYFALAHDINHARSLADNISHRLYPYLYFYLDLAFVYDLDLYFYPPSTSNPLRTQEKFRKCESIFLDLIFYSQLANANSIELAIPLINVIARTKISKFSPYYNLYFGLSDADITLSFLNSELKPLLQSLKNQLPDRNEDCKQFQEWWKVNGATWTEHLRAVAIEHRNIGHDWQFTDVQQYLLKQYYDANQLLVDCLNSDCYVSREVRQEIEDSLLLPLSEIEQNFPKQRLKY